MLYHVGRLIGLCICVFFGRMKVIGAENIPKEGGVLLCGNHVSYIDPPAVGASCPRLVHFMAKYELFHYPVVGLFMKHSAAFPVRRGIADRVALKTAIDYLNHGEVVGMFPEGKRSPDGTVQKPAPGVGLIVQRARVPVIPVALVGTQRLLPPHSYFFKFTHIKMVYGEPVPLDDLYEGSGRDAMEQIGERIMSRISALIEEHRDTK